MTPVEAVMTYDSDDPLAVSVDFVCGNGTHTTWTMGRDLVAEGLTSRRPVGMGDVRVWYCGDGGYGSGWIRTKAAPTCWPVWRTSRSSSPVRTNSFRKGVSWTVTTWTRSWTCCSRRRHRPRPAAGAAGSVRVWTTAPSRPDGGTDS